MKRYLQITIVLGILGVLVLIKQIKASDVVTATNAPAAQNVNPSSLSPVPGQSSTAFSYKDGTFKGSVQDAYYGNVQVQVVISGGKIIDVVFLQHPGDNGTSQYINSQAMPMLKQEALAAQSANVSGVSGASATSPAFQTSLADALSLAK